MAHFSDLPMELVAYLLAFCDFNDLLACQVTSRLLLEVITSSINLQYQIALQASGLEDNPRCPMSLPDKLSMLKRREAAWEFFRPTFTKTIEVNQPTVVIYELSGGTYVLSGATRQTIRHITIPHELSEDPEWTQITTQDQLLDIGLAASEHDLIAILTITDNPEAPSSTILEISYLQLSTGKPHPQAGPRMRFMQHMRPENLGVGIEIVGDLVALVIRDAASELCDRDKVIVLDWKRGSVRMQAWTKYRRYQSAIFLSSNMLLVPNAFENTIELWKIPQDPVVAVAAPELILQLPRLGEEFMVADFACRGAPNGASTTLHTHRPFHSSPTESIMVFHLAVSPRGRGIFGHRLMFIFFAHRRAFLEILAKHTNPTLSCPSLDSQDSESRRPLCWSEWGPRITRWFHARAIPTEWITTTSGQRYVFVSTHAPSHPQPVIVLDFNQNRFRNVAKREKSGYVQSGGMVHADQNEWCRVWCQEESDSIERLNIFKEKVGGSLPYVAVKSEKAYKFHGVMMDDERILGVQRFDATTGVASIEVIHLG